MIQCEWAYVAYKVYDSLRVFSGNILMPPDSFTQQFKVVTNFKFVMITFKEKHPHPNLITCR